MTNTEKSDLYRQCEYIARQIETGDLDPADYDMEDGEENPSAFDYLEDALAIEYVVSSNREYLGARVLVAFGGPNIWINTRTQMIEGAWWGDSCRIPYSRDALGIDDALSQLFAS